MYESPEQSSRPNGQDFLGRGWAFPMRLEQGLVAMVSNEEDIKQSVLVILKTRPGERVMRPAFGTPLRDMCFEIINVSTREILKNRVLESLQRWEPRIDVLSVEVEIGSINDTEIRNGNGFLLISIKYRIRSTNSEDNLVYPFYLTESSNERGATR